MKLSYFLIAMMICLSFHSCISNKEKKPAEILREMSRSPDSKIGSENFQFSLPEGWFRVDTILEGNKITFLIKENDNLRPIINVTNEFMRNKSHEAYVDGTKGELLNNMDVQLIDNGSFPVSEKNCIWYTYNRAQNGIKREMAYYSIANNGVSCNITAGVNPGGLKKYKQVFDEIVKSFRVKN
ncbi:hypothetical protein F0919_16940 [Taibaiella lutea]|uniref:Uncharacterized protein n=1 Tax=Taibaiella lutea TaxID=2608001 RepID=A0A5M6CBV0_9BACT|nr:hypothetical protein [Taibaiella lutea]KAA5532473.1 hypothetical protein F0919_16940 [Taibaiella lutea]